MVPIGPVPISRLRVVGAHNTMSDIGPGQYQCLEVFNDGTKTVYLEKSPVDRALSTQAKTKIITILFIRNILPEVVRLIKILYSLI